jgi:hypothetical protein
MKDFSLSVNSNLESAVPPTRLVYQLTRSKLLRAYLREVIIRETLDRWEQSSEYQLLRANATKDDAEEKSSDIIIDRTKESNSQEYQRTDRELLLRQYQQSEWGHLITTRFLERKSELDRVLFSAIQVADLHLAHELYCRICEQGASFTKLATLYSQRPAAKMGGAVGPISISKLHPLIHHHLIGLKPKQLSPIFQMDEQYVFLKLECWLPARFDRQMQQQLLNELFEEWLHNRIVDRIGTSGRTAEICNDESEIQD